MAPRTRFQKMAAEVGKHLRNRSAASVSAIILPLTAPEVKKLELNYPHRCGTGYETLNKYLLRDHIEKFLDKATARKLIAHLDKHNPRPKQLTPKQIADAALSPARRKKAMQIAKARGAKRWHIRLADLAEWMFSDKNWLLLCDGKLDNPRYRSERGAAGNTVWVKFFRKPNSSELRVWDTTGAMLYLHNTAVTIAKQITWFYRDIGFLKSTSGLKAQGAVFYLSGVRTKILAYRKAWHTLANNSDKQSLIKSRIMTTKDGPIKELWGPESELKKLPGWKLAT